MSFPYTDEMMASVAKVEATRKERMGMDLPRMSADDKDALLRKFHPDYNDDAFDVLKVGANKGQRAPKELAAMLQARSRIEGVKLDLAHPDYDVDVLIIGGGGAGTSAAIEAHNAGANVLVVTKLRMGDANTMMAEGGIQAADTSRVSSGCMKTSPLALTSFAPTPRTFSVTSRRWHVPQENARGERLHRP